MTKKLAGGSNDPNRGARDVPSLFAAHLAGDSLAEIGEREGLSGEPIRQLFREAGYPPLPTAYTNRQRSLQRRAVLREPLVEAFKETHAISTAARTVGCSVGLATSILLDAGIETGVDSAWVASRSKPTVTAEFCREVLIEAARRAGGTLTEKKYQEMIGAGASSSGRRWPWPSTVERRLGVWTWNEALEAAGLPPHTSGRGSRGAPDEPLLGLVTELRGSLGRPPTPKEYAEQARARGLPGVQSVRLRFGSWADFVAAAGGITA